MESAISPFDISDGRGSITLSTPLEFVGDIRKSDRIPKTSEEEESPSRFW